MSTRTLWITGALVVVLLVLTTSLAFAWPDQPPDYVTISGPGLAGTTKITDPSQLAVFKLGTLEDLEAGVLAAPPEVSGEGYQITRYFDGGSFNFASLRYYPDPAGGPGYLYFDDGPDIRGDHTPYHGQWLRARPEAEAQLRQVLAEIAPRVEAPQTAPVVSKAQSPLTLLAVMAGALTIVWVALRRALRPRVGAA